MREELRFEGEITTVVVSNNGIRWYAAIGVDTKTAPPPKRQGDAVGIDMGVRTLATLSDGTTFENPRVLTSALSALRRVDKAIARSRNTHGHNRRSVRRQRMYERRSLGITSDLVFSEWEKVFANCDDTLGPSGTGSDPFANWLRCPQMDLSIRSRGGP